MSAKRGIFVAPFGELADPNAMAELAQQARTLGGAGSSSRITSATDRRSRRSLTRGSRWRQSPRAQQGPPFPRGPGWAAIQAASSTIAERRGDSEAPFELVTEIEPGGDPGPWEAAGATWILTDIGREPGFDEVAAIISAGG